MSLVPIECFILFLHCTHIYVNCSAPADKQNRSVRCAERNCLTAHSDIYRADASALT